MSSRSPRRPEPAAPAASREGLRRCRPALGTLVDIHVSGLPAARLEKALASAFREIARCETTLSAHRADNGLARLRAARVGATLKLDARLVAVLRKSAALARMSGDAFDPRRQVSRDAPAFADSFRLLTRNRVRVLAPLDLDLGGIAKGYAIDRAHAALRRARAPSFFLNAGGDLRLHCLSTRLMLRPATGRGAFRTLGVLHAGAAATSAQTYRPHLREPRTGRLAARASSFTVLAPRAALADALTKVLALAAPETAARLLARHGAFAAITEARGRVSWLPSAPPSSIIGCA